MALYKDLYDRLLSDTSSKLNSYNYFYNLAQLIFPLKDNHLAFYQIPDYENFKDQERIEQFITTKEFLEFLFSYFLFSKFFYDFKTLLVFLKVNITLYLIIFFQSVN